MTPEEETAKITQDTLIEFCKEFVENPYLCYTEHGLHALFFTRLYNALPSRLRDLEFAEHSMCAIQKEYPTHDKLIRPRRQNWDISVIRSPIVNPGGKKAYDHLPLAAVVEFSLNYGKDHVRDDIERLAHLKSNVGLRLVAHLYRLSEAATRISRRDKSPHSTKIYRKEDIQPLLHNKKVIVYYGIYDQRVDGDTGLWRLTTGKCELLVDGKNRKEPKK
jgi:hypothetical protein